MDYLFFDCFLLACSYFMMSSASISVLSRSSSFLFLPWIEFREWTKYYDPNGKAEPVGILWSEYSAVSDGSNLLKRDLVPTSAVKSFWNDSWNSVQSIGQYYPGNNGSDGALLRGGRWGSTLGGTLAGVFAALLDSGPSDSYIDLGFRCVFAP